MSLQKTKTVIIEENFEAFLIWNYFARKKLISAENNTLIHIDEHIDMNAPRVKTSIFDISSLESLHNFTYNELSINTYIIPGIFQGLINKIYWVNNSNKNVNSRKRCVRTYNNEGKKFIVYNPLTIPGNKNIIEKKFILFPCSIDTINVTDHKNIILDISLSYFSSIADPSEYYINYIEITEAEYKEFNENYKYHNLKFEFIGHRISTKKENEKYYYIINDHNECYSSAKIPSNEDIIKKINVFCGNLKRINISPKLISINRSVKSGYTPKDNSDFIETELIKSLSKLYDLDLQTIQKITKGMEKEEQPLQKVL